MQLALFWAHWANCVQSEDLYIDAQPLCKMWAQGMGLYPSTLGRDRQSMGLSGEPV